MGGKKNRTKWRKLSLGDSGSEESPSSAPYATDIQGEDAHQEENDYEDYEQHNGDYFPDNVLSLVPDERSSEGPPTLLFPNLGPLPIVGFSSQPPPPIGPPLVIPQPHDLSDAVNGVEPDVNTNANGNANTTEEAGLYVNGLWIPRSELFKQYGGRNPPCLVYHPIPWVRVRTTASPSHNPRRGGVQPPDGHYRLYLTSRAAAHRGSWRSPRRGQPSVSPYLWCLNPPAASTPPSPTAFDDHVPLQPQPESELPLQAPPSNGIAQTPMCQASSSYVYPGYSFGPPVFTAPVLPLQPATANKHKRTCTPPPVTSEVAPSPPPTATSPKKKKKKKSKTRSPAAMESSSVDAGTAESSGQTEAPERIVHYVDSLFRSTLGQAQRQFLQLKQERLANGYKGECLATFRSHTLVRTPSPKRDLSPGRPAMPFPGLDLDEDAKVAPASSTNAGPVSIVLTVDGESAAPHVVASRSQLFLEGLEASYAAVNPVQRFSEHLLQVVFKEAFENLSGGPQPGLEGYADQLIDTIFASAKREFRVERVTTAGFPRGPTPPPGPDRAHDEPRPDSPVRDCSEVPESKEVMSKPKALVHFLEQGFHAPSSETSDGAEDNVSRERYMEGDPALIHLDMADFDRELDSLQDKMRRTDRSIYKISYDEISYTDQSEGEDLPDRARSVSAERETPRFQPLGRVFENHLRTEIPVHEAETGSEAGSEDIELIPHRYESGPTAQDKHLYVNKLSLATELLRTQENLPYDDDFKRIIDEEASGEEGTLNLGFVPDEGKVVTTGPRSVVSRFSAADSGVQSEESEEEPEVPKKTTGTSRGSLITGDDNKRIGKHVHENGNRVKSFALSRGSRLELSSGNTFMLSVCY